MDDAEEQRMIAGVRAAATRLCARQEPLTLSAQERQGLGHFLFAVADGFATASVLRVSALCAVAQHLPRDLH